MKRHLQDRPLTQPDGGKTANWVLLCSIGVLVVVVGLMGTVPPVSRDALTHHLAVPKLYLKHGGIYEIPYLEHSYFPMNLDLLYLLSLHFGNEILPKYIHFLFALLTGWLIYRYLRPLCGHPFDLLAVLFFLSLPIVVKLSISAYVDLGLVFFSSASLLLLTRWRSSGFRPRYLFGAAACCGLAMGTKYNGLLVFVILSLFVPFIRAASSDGTGPTEGACRHRGKSGDSIRAVVSAILFVCVALALFTPWAVRNYKWTGNPVYPLYKRLFDARGKSGTMAASQRLGPYAIRRVIYRESPGQIALIPLRIFFQGRDDDPRLFDGRLNPFLLVLPIFAFIRSKDRQRAPAGDRQLWLWFSVLFLLFAYFTTDMRIRYILPIVPPLVILSALGLDDWLHRLRKARPSAKEKIGKAGGILVLGVLFAWNGAYLVDLFKSVQPLDYLSGRLGRDEYIQQRWPEYAAYRFANAHLPEGSKLYGLFVGQRGYYSDREILLGNERLTGFVHSAQTPAQLLCAFRKSGITHLIVGWELFSDWAKVVFSERERDLLDAFRQSDTHLLYEKNGYLLLELNPAAELECFNADG